MKTNIILITLFLLSLGGNAQIDRSQQPKPGPAPKITLNVPQEFVLENGMKILDLMKRASTDFKTTVILVTHDLGVIAGTCDDVLVMYAGRICESASTRDLFASQRHPYTKALLNSLPSMNTDGKELYSIPGMPPDLMQQVEGCPFAPRCEHADEKCRTGKIKLKTLDSTRATACIHVQEGTL